MESSGKYKVSVLLWEVGEKPGEEDKGKGIAAFGLYAEDGGDHLNMFELGRAMVRWHF